MTRGLRFLLIAAPGALGLTGLESHAAQKGDARAYVDEAGQSILAHLKLNTTTRARLAKLAGSDSDAALIEMIAPRPVNGHLRLVAPPYLRNKAPKPTTYHTASLLGLGGYVTSDFQPSAAFQSAARGDLASQAASSDQLPWGVGSPRTGDSLPNFHYSAMPMIDFPKEWEYSLDSGDNIQSFSNAQQDVKLITQVLFNVTNGFFLDSNAGDGEHPSNTLLLELAGWRGLITEPRGYWYLNLWEKMRKAWLFLGCLSPHENSTKIGFDTDGKIDMLSGHMIHAHPLKAFLEEMGGRKTIDFWNLHSGGFEAEILNETLLGSGKFVEFGVILVRWDGRRTGRGGGYFPFVEFRSKDETEEMIFEILNNASFKYIGGLDAYFINQVAPRYHYKDGIWVNPSYFEKRGLPVPTVVKSAPPPPLKYPGDDKSWEEKFAKWDSGHDETAEINMMQEYFAKSKVDATAREPAPHAHRVVSTKLVY